MPLVFTCCQVCHKVLPVVLQHPNGGQHVACTSNAKQVKGLMITHMDNTPGWDYQHGCVLLPHPSGVATCGHILTYSACNDSTACQQASVFLYTVAQC